MLLAESAVGRLRGCGRDSAGDRREAEREGGAPTASRGHWGRRRERGYGEAADGVRFGRQLVVCTGVVRGRALCTGRFVQNGCVRKGCV